MSQLEDIEARDLGVDGEFRAEMRHAQAISDRAYLLSVVAEQAAKLDAIDELVRYLDMLAPGDRYYAGIIRAALNATEVAA